MSFDARDPYDGAALYEMWLNCQACPATFDYEPDEPLGLTYYHKIGQRAKSLGWWVSEQKEPRQDENVGYDVLCEQCACKHGLAQARAPHAQQPPSVIDEICSALKRAEDAHLAA